MQQLVQNSTRRLLKHQSELCVSMFIPTQNAESCKSNFLRLWNEAWNQSEDVYDQEEREIVFSRLRLQDVLEKLNPDFDTICLFASKKGAFFVYLDLKVPARVVIDRTFYLKPLILTISGDDQYWLLEVYKDRYALSLASLSGGSEYASAPRPKNHERPSPELKFLIRLINSDSRPWFIGGAVEEVQAARLELTRAKLRRPPAAHILHSHRPRVQESAREVVRVRARRESEIANAGLDSQNIRPLLGIKEKIIHLQRDGFQTVAVDNNLEFTCDAYSTLLGFNQTEEDLLVDDYIEDALAKKLKVIAIPRLEERIGTPIVALKSTKGVVQ